MSPEAAEIVALRLLAAVVADERRREQMMSLTGIGGDTLRTGATDPAVLGGVLDFVLGNEQMLVELCEQIDMAPDDPIRARQALPGAAPEW